MGVDVARPTKMRVVRVGRWLGLPKWEHQDTGGWECKNEDSKAQSWRMDGPAEMGMSGCRWLG